MRSLARRSACAAALAAATTALAVSAAPADKVVREREIKVTELHLGLTPGGRVGVYLAFTPRRPHALSTASVAVGERPRMVYGFYDGTQGLRSPLRDPFPNASGLRFGREYAVRISFCRSAVPVPDRSSPEPRTARAAKTRCVERSFVTMRATLHRRFAPPG